MLFIIGVLAGVAYGLSAFGGSLIIVPLLIVLLAIPAPSAMGMQLCMLMVLATITAGDGVRARLPVPGLIWPFALAASLGAGAGVVIAVYLSASTVARSYPLLCLLAGVTLFVLAARKNTAVYFPRGGLAAVTALKPLQTEPARLPPALPLIGGTLGGVFAGLFAASPATFLVPALGRVFPSIPGRAVACAEMATLPALLVATVTGLVLHRSVDWQATGLLIFGALAGLSLARMLVPRAPARLWNGLVAVGLVGVAAWMGIGKY